MTNNQTVNEKLLSLCQGIYKLKITQELISSEIDLGEIIEFTKKNRLAHYLAFKYNQLSKDDQRWGDERNKLISEYNNYKEKVKSSLKIIKEILDNQPFMVIKTFSFYPHVTSDVDIIVRDPKVARQSVRIITQKNIALPIKTDINSRISWTDDEEISSDFIWSNTQKYNFGGIAFLIPNPSLDILIRLAHIPFELAEVKLGELLHIFRQTYRVDWKILEREAKLMHWPKTYQKMVSLLESLHYRLFNKYLLKRERVEDYILPNKVEFPFRLPYILLAQAVIEKKAWKKIWGARYIIKDRIGIYK